MSTESLKKELHTLIDNTENEEILKTGKEELVAYQVGDREFNDLSYLGSENRAELEELTNEDPMKDTISYEEFKKHIEEWR